MHHRTGRILLPLFSLLPTGTTSLVVLIASLAGVTSSSGREVEDGSHAQASPASGNAPAPHRLRFVEHRSPAGVAVRILDGERPVFTGLAGDAALVLIQPSGRTVISHTQAKSQDGQLLLSGVTTNGLALSESFRLVTPGLIERTVTVAATADQRFYLDFGWSVAVAGEFYSFLGQEPASKGYTTTCAGPEFGGGSHQTFPFLGCRAGETLYGIIGDTPKTGQFLILKTGQFLILTYWFG